MVCAFAHVDLSVWDEGSSRLCGMRRVERAEARALLQLRSRGVAGCTSHGQAMSLRDCAVLVSASPKRLPQCNPMDAVTAFVFTSGTHSEEIYTQAW